MPNIGDIYAGLKLITAPVEEPVSIDDAKQHLNIPIAFTTNDVYITTMITVARQECESILRRGLILQTWRLFLKNWPGRDYVNWPLSITSEIDLYYKYDYIKLPYAAPLNSVTLVQYMNSSGQIFAMTPANFQVLPGYTYNVCPDFEPGRIYLPFSQIWPTDILMPGQPITIEYIIGYADTDTFLTNFEGAVAVCHAMKLMFAYWYENRIPPNEMKRSSINAGIQFVAEQMLMPYRCFE